MEGTLIVPVWNFFLNLYFPETYFHRPVMAQPQRQRNPRPEQVCMFLIATTEIFVPEVHQLAHIDVWF